LLALGISISLNELAIGFTIGLLHLSVWLAVVLIGAQAFLFAQIGMRLGSHLSDNLREPNSSPDSLFSASRFCWASRS
jgi:putative Mn2+ efflux pump MntP